MTLKKLNIPPKTDNAAKKQMVQTNAIGANETLLADEVNQIVEKTNELVDAYNFGAPITAFNFKGKLSTYAALANIVNPQVNDGYAIEADGLVYVYNGSAFPTSGNGLNLGLKPTPDSKVEEDNELAISGNNVYEFYESKEKITQQKYFTENGYLSKASGNFFTDSFRKTTPFMPVNANDVIDFETTIPADLTTIANVCLYNENKGLITAINNNDLVSINVSDYPTAKFVRFCGDIRFKLSVKFDFNSNIVERVEEINSNITKEITEVNLEFQEFKNNITNKEYHKYFTESGYLSKASGNILPDAVRISTPFLPINQTDVIPFKTFIPTNITTIANVCLYNENKGLITAINNNDLVSINVSDYPTAKFVRFCADTRYDMSIDFDFNSNIVERVEGIKDTFPLNNSYENNLFTQQASNNFNTIPIGSYSNANAVYSIKNKTTNGILHIAFRFRIKEDVNKTSATEKTLIRFNGKNPSDYLEYYILKKETSQFTGGEQVNSPVNSRSPIPYYNSRFGVKSSLAKTQLNKLLPERTYQYQKEGLVQTTKPLVGNDVFSIKIDAVDSNGNVIQDTTSTAAQTILQRWANAYIEVTDTGISVVNTVESFERNYTFASYALMRAMFENIYRDINGLVFNNAKITIKGINVASFDDNALANTLLRHRYYLATQYARLDGIRTFCDSFPAYIASGLDESWHTFEIVSLANKDELIFCIDGQYQNPDWGNQQSGVVTGMYSFFNNIDTITIGGENIQIRDLLYEYNEFSGVTPCRVTGTYNTIYFSSKMHPLVWNFFGHDLYHSDYSGGEYTLYTQRVSQGGKMPDSIFDTSGRKGDDFHTIDRTSIFQPTWLFENNIKAMLDAGFKPITYEQYKLYAKTGIAPYERCFVVGFDDFPTYIYARPELRRVFTKYGVKPYFAVELGWYVDEDAPTTSYVASDWITENQDTNEHRLMLQNRLLALQNDGWGIELHGAKEGFVFRGSTYNEMISAVNETISLANYLGVQSSSWCIAGNYQTPNALKIFEHNGIEMATSTIISPSSPAFSPYYMPRTLMPTSYFRQRVYFPLDN